MKPYAGLHVGFALGALLASACTDFPTIPGGVCGNAVIEEPKEDCDSFPLGPGTVCRPPGTVGACHLDCTPHDGTSPSCPSGWGCGSDFICRRPTGDFEPASVATDVGAWTLASGDFDNDGRADVMSREPLDSIGATHLSFYYFDDQARVEETRRFPKLLVSPVITRISGDGPSDVVFSVSGVDVLLGRPDRSFVPETFSSFPVPQSSARVIGVFDQRVAGISPILPLVTGAFGNGFYVPDSTTGKLGMRAPFDGTIENLAGDPVSGDLFEDPQHSPCLEPVLAERGASHFTVLNVCDTDGAGAVIWRNPFEQQNILLEPRASVDAAPLIVDLNGDGHLDVLIGAGGKPYASYGDGVTLSLATPYRLPFPNADDGTSDLTMPLAAGDVSGDGVPDFVLPNRLLISGKSSSGLYRYSSSHVNRVGAPWTTAKIGDFNANGKLDIVAATSGALNLEFFNGSGTEALTTNDIATSAPVASIAVGDFDGDLIDDIALLQRPQPGEGSSLLIAFGAPFALPAAPVDVAQLKQPEQLVSYEEGGIGNLVVAGQETIGGMPNGTLALLSGSGDRIPLAPYTLTAFSSNGSIQDALAISVATGSFSAKGQADVVAVAISAQNDRELWLAPEIASSDSTPQRLADLDSALSPAVLGTVDFSADIASTSADLNRDGRDEAIFAMPAGPDRSQCGVLVVGAIASNSAEVGARAPVLFDAACPDPELQAVDLDGDRFPDLMLLTGTDLASDRQLVVFWNDGTGGFSSSDVTVAVSNAESPRGFTVLPAAQAAVTPRALAIAYVTRSSARLISLSDSPRVFAPARTLTALSGGTGITAADVNADGVVDLVLAASGKLSVLKARLDVP